MKKLKAEYVEKIYAGWLAKIIGIRLGAPIEGWTYEQIKEKYGEVTDYLIDDKKCFAADDDSNGPLFFLRALEDSGKGADMRAQDVGEALLNYAPYEHGFFWWGGYGISTEHTAYLNLRNGIEAPRSGSIAQNGAGVAEQIGGQIFIDTWGLVAPGNTDLAAKLAKEAASVTHDGNGIYGGIFVAVCISHAFTETDMLSIIEKGLSYIPEDCEYTRVVRAVIAYHAAHPDAWRDCYRYVFENFGYDRYAGGCHIIPNTAVMILALLYGKGDFSDTLNICNMCGWDTDCNVGNIATIMGVRGGLAEIDYLKWRKPINDLLICSSVVGSLNIMDIPYGASYIAKQASMLAGEALGEPWQGITSNRIDSCHFEYPGSTHVMCMRGAAEHNLVNTDETARSGSRSLKVTAKKAHGEEGVYLYKKTYYLPCDFRDNRYDPTFSPIVYPGQTLRGSVYVPETAADCTARLYALNLNDGQTVEGEEIHLKKGEWIDLAFTLPPIENGLIREAGFVFKTLGDADVECFIDDFFFEGNANYTIDCAKLKEDKYNEVRQFARLKGITHLENGLLNISCADFAESYTGRYDWADYSAAFTFTPLIGEDHFVNVRVQGGIRSYAAGLTKKNKLGLYKNNNGCQKLAETDFKWECGKEYTLTVQVSGAEITVFADGTPLIHFADKDRPYLTGGIGISVRDGSRSAYRLIAVE